ncbi:MAG TPA: DUF4350 domain-containing protein [Longimicrobium sp.]|nr:DUF4350 domain-containing protein [Longimicrobium sp.]
MPDRRNTVLMAALALVLVLLAGLVGRSGRGGRSPSYDPRASTYVSADQGLLALYWTLDGLRIPVRRTHGAFETGRTVRGAVVLMAPIDGPTPEEAHRLAEHVRGGGTLVFAPPEWMGDTPLGDTLGLEVDWGERRMGASARDTLAAAAARPHAWTRGVAAVSGFRRTFADDSPALAGATPLLAVDGDPAAVTFPLGRGTVVAFAEARPFGNARLRTSGGAVLFARMAADLAARGDTLGFSEYHQGFQGEGRLWGATGEFFRRHPLGNALAQVGLAAALLLLVGARRFGAPLPPPPARRRSPLEHVEALAGAYRQAGARRTARRLLLAGLARRLGRRAPADEAAAAQMLDRLARQSPVGRDAAAELKRTWERGQAADLAALARGVDNLLEEVRRA